MSPSARKVFLPLHLWSGITLGLVLMVVALSGCILVFRPKFERTLDPKRFIVEAAATRLPIDELVARARVAEPAAELESVRFYGDPTMPLLVYFTNKEYVHMNPHTGAVLGVRKRYGEGFGWIEGLHKYIQLNPQPGETVNGTIALVFAFILLSGLALWWPATRRALKAGVTLNPRLSGRPWNLNLHKTIGAYAMVVILFSALSGAAISFDWLKYSLYPLTGSTKLELPTPIGKPGAKFAGFDAINHGLAERMPNATETYIALPKDGRVSSYCIAADAPHPNARSYVWFDPGTARALAAQPYATAPRGFRLYYTLLSLHTTVTGGWLVQLVMTLGALTVPILAWTGTASYLHRKYGRKVKLTANVPASRVANFVKTPVAQ